MTFVSSKIGKQYIPNFAEKGDVYVKIMNLLTGELFHKHLSQIVLSNMDFGIFGIYFRFLQDLSQTYPTIHH